MYGKSRRPVGPAPGTQEQIQSFRKDRPYGHEGCLLYTSMCIRDSHDTVHEMAKDEARHGKGFEGLYNRYFKK